MARKAVKAAKAETPKQETAKPAKQELVPTMPNSKAITADAGMTALRMIAQSVANARQIEQLREANKELVGAPGSNRGKAQVILAMAVYGAGLADPTVRADLPKCWSEAKSDTNYLYKRLRMAIGTAKADGVETDEARAMQNKAPGDDEETIKAKESIRTQFQAMLSKATKVALHALDHGLKLEKDTSGFLRITDGKKSNVVKQQFGASSVLLNEDQNMKVLDKKGQVADTVTLKVKPSFTEVMRRSGEDHGKKVESRADSRTKTLDVNTWIINTCNSMIATIGKLPTEIPDPVNKALVALHSALDARIA